MDEYPEIMTIAETSKYIRVPLSTLYKLAQSGKIPCQKVGRHWRFRKETINNWMDLTGFNSNENIIDPQDENHE